jgi:hypothetical protein
MIRSDYIGYIFNRIILVKSKMKLIDLIAHLLFMIVSVEAKGGGRGGGSGGRAGGAATSGLSHNEDGDEEEDIEATKAEVGSNAARMSVSIFMLICVAVAGVSYLLFAFRRLCRPKKDLKAFLGVSLARIHNVDCDNPEQRVRMGVGIDQRNINEWVEDIWESFDRDGNGSIDKYEIRGFLDQTFKTAGMRINYTEDDFDLFWRAVDLTGDGLVSRAEMRNFLEKLGKQDPPKDLEA